MPSVIVIVGGTVMTAAFLVFWPEIGSGAGVGGKQFLWLLTGFLLVLGGLLLPYVKNTQILNEATLSSSNLRILYLGGVWAVLCIGLYLRLLGLEKGVWIDEASTLERIADPNFPLNLHMHNHPPLYYLLLKLWSLINDSQPFLRSLSVCCGMSTIVVVIKWLKPYTYVGSLLAGLCCATLPMMVDYSQELKNYSLIIFATALSFYFASRLAGSPERLWNYIGLGTSLAIAVASHAIGVMLLPGTCIYVAFAFAFSQQKKVRLGPAILTLMIPACLFAFLFFLFLDTGPTMNPNIWWMPPVSVENIRWYASDLLGISQVRSVWWTVNGILPFLTKGIVFMVDKNLELPISILLLLCLIPFGNWRRSLPSLAGCITYWGMMLIFSLLVLPILYPRTLLPGMIPFVGFVGIQIGTIRKQQLKLVLIIGLITMCFAFAVYWVRDAAGKPKEAWDQISQLLESNPYSNRMILLYPDEPVQFTLKYYMDLPPETTVPISEDFDITEAQLKEIRDRFYELQREGPTDLFLVVRLNDEERSHSTNYQRLVAYLKTEFGDPTIFQKFGQLSLAKYDAHHVNP